MNCFPRRKPSLRPKHTHPSHQSKAFSLSTLLYGIATLTFLPIPKAEAATNFNCPGQFPQNRMQFSVSYLDGRFTTITLTPQS
ncbi:MAG TPA: hypothetical protein V6D21_14025, partial [Candidatus Obscuribacterales bacterium]